MKQQNNQIEWKEFKVLEVIECVENGNRPKGGVGSLKEGIPSIGGEHINKNGGFDFSNIKFISKEFFEAQKRGIIRRGDVLVVKDGATTGRVTFVSKDNFPYKEALVNEHVFILRPKNSMIVPKFLFYSLYGKEGQKKILDNFHGSAQGGINTQFAKNVLLYVPFFNGKPCLEEQERIVSILEKAEKQKERSKKANNLLDEYLKSVFNEMFLKYNFELAPLGEVSPLQGGFAFKSKDFTEKGVKLVKITNVWSNLLVWGDQTLLPETYLNKYTQFSLHTDDIVLSMTRPIIKSLNSVKVVKISKEDLPCLLNQRVGRFIINKKRISADYLLHYCYTSDFKREVEKYCSTSLQPNISSNQVNSIKIPLPPLYLQQKFSKIVEKVEKMKENVKKTKQNSEELFDSLMQKAFKGGLVR